MAADLAQALLPNALRVELPPVETLAHFRASPKDPADDPIFNATAERESRIVCLVNAAADLIYPPPLGAWPEPQPVEMEELDESQRAEWQALREATFGAEDLGPASALYERFLASQPAPRVAALASFQWAALLALEGDISDAAQLFEMVLGRYGEIPAESGFPLKIYAGMQLILLAPLLPDSERRRVELVTALSAQAVLEPSPLSRFLLNKLDELERNPIERSAEPEESPAMDNGARRPRRGAVRQGFIGERWSKLWEAHEAARIWHDAFQKTVTASEGQNDFAGQGFWLNLDGGPKHLALLQRAGDGTNY